MSVQVKETEHAHVTFNRGQDEKPCLENVRENTNVKDFAKAENMSISNSGKAL